MEAYFCLWEFYSCILGSFFLPFYVSLLVDVTYLLYVHVHLYHGSSFCVTHLSSFLVYLCPLFDFASYCVELDRILNSRYLKICLFFFVEVYIPWYKFYMWVKFIFLFIDSSHALFIVCAWLMFTVDLWTLYLVVTSLKAFFSYLILDKVHVISS